MKTKSVLILMMLCAFGTFAQTASDYCETMVTHFNIAGETASAINLTITNVDANTMYVEIESADADPVDLLLVNNGSGATISESDASVPGKIRRTLTFSDAPPTDVSIELLWSKESFGGNWMLNTFTVPFLATCGSVPTDTEIPTLFTATKGVEGVNSVELLLNATDNSGTVKYTISYGTSVLNTSGTSGVEKSYVVTGLTASTAYSFSIVAKDAAGNEAVNNPIVVAATTTGVSEPASGPLTTKDYDDAKVINIFSDLYAADLTTINFDPFWGQATDATIVTVASDNIYKMANLNYQGVDFGASVSAVPMKFLHVDVWTADETSLNIYCINKTPAPYTEKKITLTPLAFNSWVGYDIPLTDFTDQGMVLDELFQFKFEGSGGKTVFLDNLFFYDNSTDVDAEIPTLFTATAGEITYQSIELLLNASDNSGAVDFTITYGATTLNTSSASGVQKSYVVTGLDASTAYSFSVLAKDPTGNEAVNNPIVVNASTVAGLAVPTTAAPTPPAYPDASIISIFSDAFTNVAGSNFDPFWGQATDATIIDIELNPTLKYDNLNYQGTDFGSDVDASEKTFLHVDVWSPNETSLSIFCISRSTGERFVDITPSLLNEWNSIDIPLVDFTDQGLSVADLFQFKVVGSGGKVVYLDNLYFLPSYPTAVDDVVTQSELKIYPNPATNRLALHAKSEMRNLIIRNLIGQVVLFTPLNAMDTSISLSGVDAGNYMVTVVLQNGTVITQKLAKL